MTTIAYKIRNDHTNASREFKCKELPAFLDNRQKERLAEAVGLICERSDRLEVYSLAPVELDAEDYAYIVNGREAF